MEPIGLANTRIWSTDCAQKSPQSLVHFKFELLALATKDCQEFKFLFGGPQNKRI